MKEKIKIFGKYNEDYICDVREKCNDSAIVFYIKVPKELEKKVGKKEFKVCQHDIGLVIVDIFTKYKD